MPDCSAVTVIATLPEELADKADEILAELGDITNDGGWDWKPARTNDGEAYVERTNAALVIHWSDYDCPWGTNTPDKAGLFARLRELGIAYTAIDYGHYTWDGSTEVWRPGMDEPKRISSGVDGTLFVAAAKLWDYRDQSPTAFKAGVLDALAPFFEDEAVSV